MSRICVTYAGHNLAGAGGKLQLVLYVLETNGERVVIRRSKHTIMVWVKISHEQSIKTLRNEDLRPRFKSYE
jgi:hypothetical protein